MRLHRRQSDLQSIPGVLTGNWHPDVAADNFGELGEFLDIGVAEHLLALHAGLAQTVSVGVAKWRPGMGAAELLATADAALYEAKHMGRNRVVSKTG